MSMTDIVDLEEAFTKTGSELFKELYRIYPVADPEDYFKQGQWKNEVMKQDLILIESHRRESGAPDVPDLDDTKLPPMPGSGSPAPVGAFMGGTASLLKPAATTGAVAPMVAKPVAVATAVGNSSPVVEIRLIALFVAKWKLEPVTSKTLLAKLTPARRRYVIANFKTTVVGAEATKELEKYIADCELDGSWDSATDAGNGDAAKTVTPAGATPSVVAPNPAAVAAAALKRPLTPVAANPAWAANKRPALASAGVVRPPAFARPPMWGKGAW